MGIVFAREWGRFAAMRGKVMGGFTMQSPQGVTIVADVATIKGE